MEAAIKTINKRLITVTRQLESNNLILNMLLEKQHMSNSKLLKISDVLILLKPYKCGSRTKFLELRKKYNLKQVNAEGHPKYNLIDILSLIDQLKNKQ